MPKKKSSCCTVQELIGRGSSGLSVLQRGDKSPMQKDFFKNMGDLLPTLRFLGRLYNFCNFVIYIFFEEWHFTDSEMIEYYQKMCGWSSKSTKTKNCSKLHQIYYAKNHFLWLMLGLMAVMRISKLCSAISILKPWC